LHSSCSWSPMGAARGAKACCSREHRTAGALSAPNRELAWMASPSRSSETFPKNIESHGPNCDGGEAAVNCSHTSFSLSGRASTYSSSNSLFLVDTIPNENYEAFVTCMKVIRSQLFTFRASRRHTGIHAGVTGPGSLCRASLSASRLLVKRRSEPHRFLSALHAQEGS
jgi:hypothetical protein